jgi:Mrp family chromosome partitioning ATPase
LVTSETAPSPDHDICQQAWNAGTRLPDASERLRYVDRHRSRTSWFMPLRAPSQAAPTDLQASAPVIAFYSFKGGMGRTTAAAAYALRQAKAGRRVVAIDLDLDAPGLGRLLGTEAGARSISCSSIALHTR